MARSDDDATRKNAEASAEAYKRLHGVAPRSVTMTKFVGPKGFLNTLGPVTRVCYLKRIHEDGVVKDPGPEYCHDYGEGWPKERFAELADEAAHDAKGDLYIVPKGNTHVTSHGIEDKPVKHATKTTASGEAHKPRENPTQTAVALTQIKVRTPSQFLFFVQGLGPGLLGALPPLLLEKLILEPLTRFSPGERAMIVGGLGSLMSVLTGAKNHRVGVGMALGTAMVATPNALEAYRIRSAVNAAPSLPPVAPTTPAAPAAEGTTTPSTEQPSGAPRER